MLSVSLSGTKIIGILFFWQHQSENLTKNKLLFFSYKLSNRKKISVGKI